ncbi:MAG: RluA family pseudouridine synthase [Candidatus Marinimicrobia bacterium]|nr:RluA family pseudouridine synthase [Candidatus Neomarinimicrobiota bacterium]
MTNKIKNSFTFKIPEDINTRLDYYLSEQIQTMSRSKIARLIRSGFISVNGKPVKPSYFLEAADTIRVDIPEDTPKNIQPQPIDLDIIFEDEYYIAVNKPKNISVHPGAGISDGTIVNGLMHYTRNLSTVGGSERPGLVHRLDKDTTGALICAKTDEAHWKMSELFSNRKIYKEYRTLVWGLPPATGLIDKPIARSLSDRKTYTVNDETGKPAKTEYEILSHWDFLSYLKVILHTGRTHQIRVHMKHIHCPVLGDPTYGNDTGRLKGLNQAKRELLLRILKNTGRQMLHSYQLGFVHPFTGQDTKITAPLSADFQEALDMLNNNKELLIGY